MPEFLLSWFLETLSPFKASSLLSEKVNSLTFLPCTPGMHTEAGNFYLER